MNTCQTNTIKDETNIENKHIKIIINIYKYIKTIFDSEPVYDDQYLKTKMICYKNVIKANYCELP